MATHPPRGKKNLRWYNRDMRDRIRTYRCEAIVLRRHNFGEADRLLTVFSLERGKLRLMAKGVRKPRSRKAGHVEPFTRVALINSRGREIDIISQADALDLYTLLRENLRFLGRAAYFAELVDRFSVDREENRQLYRLLADSFSRLDQEDTSANSVARFFEIRLLELVGYRPELFNCVRCSAEIRPEDQFFSHQDGGVVCPHCAEGRRGFERISLSALKVLRHYQRNSYKVASEAAIRAEVHQEIDGIMEGFFSYLLERNLNSPTFIRDIDRIDSDELPSNIAAS